MAYFEQPERILLPVKVSYMALTVVLAILFNLLPWHDLIGVPDMAALVVAFWCVRQPRRMGIGIAWFVGLVMDAGNGAITLHRRILWFSLWQQAAHVLLLLLASQALMLGVRLAAGGVFPGPLY